MQEPALSKTSQSVSVNSFVPHAAEQHRCMSLAQLLHQCVLVEHLYWAPQNGATCKQKSLSRMVGNTVGAFVAEAGVGETEGGIFVGDPVVGDEVFGEMVVGEAVVGVEDVGDEVVGDAVVGDAVVGAGVVGDRVVGETVVGEGVVGELVVGDAVVGAEEVGDGVVEGNVVVVVVMVVTGGAVVVVTLDDVDTSRKKVHAPVVLPLVMMAKFNGDKTILSMYWKIKPSEISGPRPKATRPVSTSTETQNKRSSSRLRILGVDAWRKSLPPLEYRTEDLVFAHPPITNS